MFQCKKFIANSTKNMVNADASQISAIDWHLDFGELEDDVERIRENIRRLIIKGWN